MGSRTQRIYKEFIKNMRTEQNMASKQEKLSFSEIEEKINGLKFTEKSKSKDFVSLINEFCKLQNVSADSEEIGRLFDFCMSKAGENDWKFLLEVFSRLFYKYDPSKKRPVNGVLSGLCQAVAKKFGGALDENALKAAVVSRDPAAIKEFAEKLQSTANCNETAYPALLFILLVFSCNRLSQNKNSDILLIERCLCEQYGVRNAKDKYLIKTIAGALKGPNAQAGLHPFTALYEGTSQQISQLEEEKGNLTNRLSVQSARVRDLLSELEGQQNTIKTLNAEIDDKKARIASLEKELEAKTDQNEFNENLYQKQFETLKSSFIKSLKKKIQLDLLGIEDLAATLPDGTKSKIQRRLDNIYKTMQKEGE